MFCSNCGAELAEGAKFCSECGTKVEGTQAKSFDAFAFDESAAAQEKTEERAMSMEEAFKEKVSFDWSNVIDEPQKREVPQGIKSPWAATTGNIDERELYAEMTQSDDKNRTMSFIDVLKADKEERERAALDKSIEYTEVLELDPELLGGTKPPKMHMPPLYEDVDEPVKTPFDIDETVEAYVTGQFDSNIIEETATPKFELPDFLKMDKDTTGEGEDGDDPARFEKTEGDIAEADDSAEQIPAESEVAKLAYAFSLKDMEETADSDEEIVEQVATETVEEYADAVSDDTANLYLDLDIASPDSEGERISRATAHALAGDYDEDDDDGNAAADDVVAGDDVLEEESTSVDENELFREMNETPGAKTGMTIAAPADEEAEIEVLKRRLAELTGTLEMDSALLEEQEKEPEAEIEEDEPEFEDFIFEPEVTSAEDKFFEGLISAREAAMPAAEISAVEPTPAEALEEFAAETEAIEPASAEAPVLETEAIAPAPAEVPVLEEEAIAPAPAEVPMFEEEAIDAALTAEPVAETPVGENANGETVTEEVAAEPEPADVSEEPVTVAFGLEPETAAPSATQTVGLEPEPTVIDFASMMAERENNADDTMGSADSQMLTLEDFASEAPEGAETAADSAETEQTKPTDAVSLEDLENSLFGPIDDANETEAGSTKKIDKFYTLYRKNEEFQRLLDEEYSRLKGEHIEISEEEVDKELGLTEDGAEVVAAATDTAETTRLVAAEEKPAEEASPVAAASQDIAAALKDIATESRPVEDATIYRMEMPEELKELTQEADEKKGLATDSAAENTEAKPEKKSRGLFGKSKDKGKKETGASFGLGGEDVTASASADVVAAKDEVDFAAANTAAEEAATAPEPIYQDVDGGSTILTILAVLVAILLVFLLVVILIIQFAPQSNIALMVEQIIENITSRFSALDTTQGLKLL